ncbi:hypothetical protein PENTCL1PPCAC_21719, partial [Pristionchus entomophagus]
TALLSSPTTLSFSGPLRKSVSYFAKEQFQVRSRRQVGGAQLSGCRNAGLSQIMQHVVGPLQSVNRMRLGDIAKILQQSVQHATGQSHEILMGKG